MDDERKQQDNARARRYRARLKASGLCTYGCGNLADPDHTSCGECRGQYLKGGKYGCDKPGRNRSRKNLGLPDRRSKAYRDSQKKARKKSK